MSKGKQWWPFQATTEEQRKTITEFQQRLRDRQWLKGKEKVDLLYIHAFEQTWNTEHLPSVNEYMQISSTDTVVKNQARVTIVRLLAMLLKWHQSLRPDTKLLSPPNVFTVPNVVTGGFSYGLIAVIEGDQRYAKGKTLTLVVSDFDVSLNQPIKGRKWVLPQGSDTFKWLTVKQWLEQRKKPSFGKWIFASFLERRSWLETKHIQEDLLNNGLIKWNAPFGNHANKIAAIKLMGGTYIAATKSWYLPEFWDADAVKEYLETIVEEQNKPFATKTSYKEMAEQAKISNPPLIPPEDDDPHIHV